MPQKPFTSETKIEAIATFESGMDSGVAPLLLKRNQLSFATNMTVRGAYCSHRPPFAFQTLDYGGDTAVQNVVENGLFQGAAYYRPDATSLYVIQPWSGTSVVEVLIASISGYLFMFTPDQNTAKLWHVSNISIPGDPDSATVPQVWLWQAENYMFVTDGTTNLPIYFDGTSSRRSIGNDPDVMTIGSSFAPWNNTTYPAVGGLLGITLNKAPQQVWAYGTPIQGVDLGEYIVYQLGGLATQYVLQRVQSATKPLVGPAPGSTITYPLHIYPEFPSGRVGTYGMGRSWMSLPDAKQFLGGDIVGGPSGTSSNSYRDAVLHTNENSLIAGGGYFTTPGAYGDIRAMIFATTLDVSLGQGPLQVLTPTKSFSCYAPTDRTTWFNVTNPILTESLIGNGSETFYGTVQVNGDIIYRAVDGIRSLILGRRDFDTWGNVPASSEMNRVLALDNPGLLRYCSAIVFDNRLLMTCSPNSLTGKGVFHNGIIALDFDPLSNIRGKLPSVFDGLWTGINTLQLVVGRFVDVERAFAFTTTYDPASTVATTQLFEILPTPQDVYSPITVFEETNWLPDNQIYDQIQVGPTPIVWTGESPVLFKADDPKSQDFQRMIDGEILVDNLQGIVDFALFYRPDQYPCWVPWHEWTECARNDSIRSKAQFRPRMGLGEPSSKPCDETLKRALREAYTFQVKWIIQGHCRLLGARFKAVTIPLPQFAPPNCATTCPSATA